MTTLKAIIFDHSTLTETPGDCKAQVLELLERVRHAGLKIVVNANDPINLANEMAWHGLPEADLYLTKREVGENKGSKEWIYKTCELLGVRAYELLYVGDSLQDWRSAINSAVLYLQAEWSQAKPLPRDSLIADTPRDVWIFATHYLMQPPRWEYTLDGTASPSHIRSLLKAGRQGLSGRVRMPYGWQDGFELKDIFHHKREVTIGESEGRDVLMMHALSSLYLEGYIPEGPYLAAYPSHTAGKLDGLIQEWIQPISKAFHGWFKSDLLVRVKDAPDTSYLRFMKRKATPEMQMSTVQVNPKYKGKLDDRTVILFDDFTTSGTSLDWGRNLLLAAGAAKVVLITVGKFGQDHPLKHSVLRLKDGAQLNPFSVYEGAATELFDTMDVSMTRDVDAAKRTMASLSLIYDDEPME